MQPGLWVCLHLCWKPVQSGRKVTEDKVLRFIRILNLLYWVEMVQGGIDGLRLYKEFSILKSGLSGLMNK